MRLHTSLTQTEVYGALVRAIKAGHVTGDVQLIVFAQMGSMTHPRAFEVQLGTYDKHSLPAGYRDQYGKLMHVRRYKNGGNAGATSEYYGRDGAVWAATWHEWGWWMAEVFKADPGARFGPRPSADRHGGYGIYASPDDFHEKTHGAFREDGL